MEEGRILSTIRKPKVVISRKFPVFEDLELGDKGQLDVELEIVGSALEPDSTMTEYKNLDMRIISAKKFGRK